MKKALRLGIESADIEESGEFRWQEIEDGVASIRIFAGRNETGRLVEHDVERWSTAHQLALHLHVIALGRLSAEVGADPAVDRDSPSAIN